MSAFADAFACPVCYEAALEDRDATLTCTACHQVFPRLLRVPILMPRSTEVMAHWQTRYAYLMLVLEAEVAAIKDSLSHPAILPETSVRLRHLMQAKVEHGKCLQKVLAPLVEPPWGTTALHQIAHTALPPAQQLMGYYTNIFRDWNWGDEENRQSLALLLRLHGERAPARRTAIWGAGAGRLAFDWHNAGLSEQTFALDVNPFSLLIADRMSRGQETTLYEFPIAPKTAMESAVKRRLAAPGKGRPGLFWLMADALHLPCREPGMNLIITPWLIDVVPEAFPAFAAAVHRRLAPGGVWLNMGSLAYNHGDPGLCFTREEVLATLRREGFGVEAHQDDAIPYLRCPESRQSRSETTFAFAAIKTTDTSHALAKPAVAMEWDPAQPLAMTPALQQKLMINRLFIEIVGKIDGKCTAMDLSQHVATMFGLAPAQAETLVRQFLGPLYSQADAGRQF